jgi:prefoldin subunit 5
MNEDNESNIPEIINHSSYYDFEQLSAKLQTCKSKFTIFSSNIQSINAKIDELKLFIDSLKTLNFMLSSGKLVD